MSTWEMWLLIFCTSAVRVGELAVDPWSAGQLLLLFWKSLVWKFTGATECGAAAFRLGWLMTAGADVEPKFP